MNSQDNKKQEDEKPVCFGALETVFPMGEDGLRVSPERCIMGCTHKTDCLRSALEGSKGDSVQNEMLDRKYESGTIGFLERWSKKKALASKIRK